MSFRMLPCSSSCLKCPCPRLICLYYTWTYDSAPDPEHPEYTSSPYCFLLISEWTLPTPPPTKSSEWFTSDSIETIIPLFPWQDWRGWAYPSAAIKVVNRTFFPPLDFLSRKKLKSSFCFTSLCFGQAQIVKVS